MKSVLTTAIVLGVLFLAGCGSDSALPNPTGKGSIRALNAINGAPIFNFLIEERSAGTMEYKEISTPTRFDDFEYRFNFEVVLAGAVTGTRVATRVQKIDANQEYTFVVTGSIEAPDVLVWDKPERVFTESETVFEMQFAHLVDGFAAVDVFVAAAGVAPVAGAEVATLAFGEIAPARDFESGDYVVTVTQSGDPSAVVFESDTVTFGSGNSLLIGVFSPTGNDIDAVSVRGFTSGGGSSLITAAGSSPTLRIVHSSQDLGNVDIYDDEALTSVVASNAAFKDVSGDLPIAAGDGEINVTPAGSTATLLLESDISIIDGTRNNLIITGTGGTYLATGYIPDRTSVQTVIKSSVFNGASNFELIDLYAVVAGTGDIEESLPRAAGIRTGTRSATAFILDPGSYDFYTTPFAEKTILAGPLTIDVASGDIVELILFDTVAPDVGELVQIPAP